MAKQTLNDDGFKLGSTRLDDDHWFYADRRGLSVVFNAKGTLQNIAGIIEIPWSKLKQPIEAHQKLVRKRARAKKRGA